MTIIRVIGQPQTTTVSVSSFRSVPQGVELTSQGDGTLFLSDDGTYYPVSGGGGGSSPTNLSVANKTSTTFTILSSTGTDATLPQATTTEAGLLNSADKTTIQNLATVATSGSYADLTGTPTIPSAQVNSDWESVSGLSEILNKPSVFPSNVANVTGLQTVLDGKQPLDGDLTAIAALAGTSGFLKKTAVDTWTLDTSNYYLSSNPSGYTTNLGTVTTASVVSANGFAGAVATSSTTPAITISTTITGLLKGNGTAISAATAGTDYLTPTGSAASLTGLTSGQVTTALGFTPYNATNPSGYTSSTGTVTTASIVTANGFSGTVATASTTPAITLSLQDATSLQSGQLTSTDWNTFNGKQAALVSGTNIKTVNGNSLLGVGDLVISGGTANLSLGTITTTTIPVNIDTGTDIILPSATTLLAGLQSAADKTKLDGIATGATANSSDVTLLARANHTGTQTSATISDFTEASQDSVGAMVDTSLVYVDATPLLQRAALTGAITAAAGSNTTALGSFTLAQLNAAVSDADVANATHTHTASQITDFNASADARITAATGVSVQAFDADLSAIAALAGTSGLARKTAANTWSLDTAAYITGNESITVSGDVSGSGTTAITATISSNAVTNTKLAQVPTATFKGRITTSTGNVEDLTATQATSLLDTFTSGSKGLVGASGGGTTNFLRADGTWATPAGGGGGGLTLTEIEVDFGAKPVRSKKFTITAAGVTGSSKIIVNPSGNVATGRVGDDWEWDSISTSAKAGTGQFVLTCFASGKVAGKRKFYYTYS